MAFYASSIQQAVVFVSFAFPLDYHSIPDLYGAGQTMIIYPRKTSLFAYLREVFRYKDLLYLMSKKWIRLKYEHSVIGIGWIVINPLITTIVYTIFFGMAFKVGFNRSHYFLYIYSGMLPWLFFRDVFLDILDVFTKEPNTIKRTNFPRLIVPLSSVLLKLVEFSFGIIVLFIVAAISGKAIGIYIFLLPVLIFQMVLLSMGLGLIFLFPCLIYRDIKHILRFILPLGLYSLPIVYMLAAVPAEWLRTYMYNPMVPVIQSFRAILFNQVIPWGMLGGGLVTSLIVFIVGLLIFIKHEKKIAELI